VAAGRKAVREFDAEALQDAGHAPRAQFPLQLVDSLADRARAELLVEPADDRVEDLVQDAERVQLAGGQGGRTAVLAGARLVHPRDQPARGADVGRDDTPVETEERAVEPVPRPGGAGNVELPHHRQGCHAVASAVSFRRAAWTCSIERRRSSRPEGSNS
jgi:hypothetical protein